MQKLLETLAVAAALMAAATPVEAVTTLNVRLGDFTCGVTSAAGITTPIACSGSSVGAELYRGDSVFINAIAHISYRDDGLAVVGGYGIQMDPEGQEMLYADHEAGVILFKSNLCQGHNCYLYDYENHPWEWGFGTGMFPPVILGLNDTPDRFTQDMEVFSGVLFHPGQDLPFSTSVGASISVWMTAVWSVPVVPEPSTYALMLAGLAAVGLAASRRRTGGFFHEDGCRSTRSA